MASVAEGVQEEDDGMGTQYSKLFYIKRDFELSLDGLSNGRVDSGDSPSTWSTIMLAQALQRRIGTSARCD